MSSELAPHQAAFDNEEAAKKRMCLYRDGYLLIKGAELHGVQEFVERVNQLTKQTEFFEYQKKQNGTATLKLPILYQQNFIVDYLFESGLLEKVFAFVGHLLFLTNFKHYLSQGKAPALGWHRDTYLRGNKVNGMIPAPFKIAIYSTHSNEENACTEVLAGSHRIDLQSPWLDRALILSHFRRKVVIADPGDVLLFNVNILHCRRKAKEETNRSAIIFGLAPSVWHQQNYAHDGNEAVIRRYNGLMKDYGFNH